MNYVFLSVNAVLISACAYAVITNKWYRSLPVLGTYWFALTLTSLLLLVTFVGQQLPCPLRATFCRIYYYSYFMALMLISIFSIAILFEFLFHMARGGKGIQKIAVAGCLITAGLSLAAAFQWGHTMEHFVDVFWRATTLTLLLAGLFIWVMKAALSLVLQKRLAIVLAVIAICPFAETIVGYWKSDTGQFISDLIQPLFTLVIYAVLRKGPAAQEQVISTA